LITFIVGQRGVGKSTFLSRVQTYYSEVGIECVVIDSDREIELQENKTIKEIFSDRGRDGFRKLEAEVIKRLGEEYKNHSGSVYIAVGAGYAGPFTDPSQVLWLRRPTDRDGRIFFDRPKLNEELSHFEDYMTRFNEREYKYLQTSDEQLMMTEGLVESKKYETVFLGFPGHRTWGCLTLYPKDLRKFSGPESFIGRRLHWEIDRFEVRDDILEDNLIRYILGVVPKEKLLLSFRQPHKTFLSNISLAGVLFDWPHEKGRCPYPGPGVYSMHSRQESLMDSLLKFEESAPKDFHLKLAVPIETWSELLDGHLWWREDPLNRTFLPSSKDGRWRWYRALFGRQMKVSFFREGAGSSQINPS
jgi:shikimate kinase